MSEEEKVMLEEEREGGKEMKSEEKRTLGVEEILLLLPHRYPFMLIDRVEDWRKNHYIRARKAVTYNEGFFQGHFPHYKVMPGVLQLEMVAQAAAILEALGSGLSSDEVEVRFVKADEVRFFREVRPGDVVDIYVEETKRRDVFRWGFGEVSVEGERVMSMSIVASFAKRDGT
jgi:3-hydroxymyristoyl/3-hydroxydecanoyl-(acyl carrier protein) dehydratase